MTAGAALVATLGSEPQVVFFALKRLAQLGVPIRQGLVCHTRSPEPAIRDAVVQLKRAWPSWAGAIPLRLLELPMEDLDSESALQRAYAALREAYQELKKSGLMLHLCLSGGRKPLAILAFLAAQFLFGANDRVWYLYSPPEVEEAKLAASPLDPRVRLLELPLPIWTELPLLLEAVQRFRDPWTAAQVQRALVRQGERRRWQEFFERRLTPAEQEVVRALVLQGGTNKALAEALGKSTRTVGHQLASVYRKVRAELGAAIPVDRTAVASLFAPVLRP